jgi:signal transduction histidine kinase/DNA-binding NarL/FixJ family response regulator
VAAEVFFDGLRPEAHPAFSAVQRISLRVGQPTADAQMEPAVVRYRLSPIESNWSDATGKPEIEFNALRPGRYTFEAQQVRFGLTSPATTVRFAIPQPWFLRWPSLLAYAIALPLLGYCGFRLRMRQVVRRNEELQQLVRARTNELEKANAAKSEFLAMMSHEIRNPMNGVIGLVQNLRDSVTSPRDLYTLKLLAGCSEQLRSTVDDVLDFSKIEAGEIDLSPALHPVADLVREAMAIVGEEARFTVENLPADSVLVSVDSTKVRQILVNYLTNALKYGTPPGGALGVLLQDHAGRPQLTLSVRSSGPTIPKDALDSLFEAFTRGEEARRANIRGTGLGLAICRKFALRMGGNVGAVSANGETTFYLTLPLESSVGATATPSLPLPAPRDRLEPAKALAIEDEDYNRVVLASILAKLNYTVDWATNGHEALQLAQAHGYDIILTDLRLPDINGADLARQLLALCPEPKPAVFAVTAYSTREKQEECAAAGMAGFISKPITLEKLHRAIHEWGKNRLARVSIERSPRPLVYPDIAAGWRDLRPAPTARAVHALNNLCRHHGLTDVAEQLELLEGALEDGRDPAPFLCAAENLLTTAGVLAPS